jgi:hypothetical protein
VARKQGRAAPLSRVSQIAKGTHVAPSTLRLPSEGFLVTQFITVRSGARSRAFYSELLGGQVVLEENPGMIKLSNSWGIINPGGALTPDKPDISVVDYELGNAVSSFMNLPVAAIQACDEQWSSKGAEFVTPLTDRGPEIRCYMRNPRWLPDRGRPIHWTARMVFGQEAARRSARLRRRHDGYAMQMVPIRSGQVSHPPVETLPASATDRVVMDRETPPGRNRAAGVTRSDLEPATSARNER